MNTASAVPRPSACQSLFEFRALFEAMALAPASPLLKLAARGEGQPVLVFPGFFASDRGTALMRRFLNSKGFAAYPWEQGRNPGLHQELYLRLEERLLELSATHGRKVSIVGWSLGGLYARLLAHQQPEHVARVITLASPFKITNSSAIAGPVERLIHRANPDQGSDPILQYEGLWKTPPPVPSTAIYSEGDGVVHWSFCVDEEDDYTESLRVPSSHIGMAHNPLVLYALADRLAQAEGSWRRFRWVPHLQQILPRRRIG